jgi:hypothetical protein
VAMGTAGELLDDEKSLLDEGESVDVESVADEEMLGDEEADVEGEREVMVTVTVFPAPSATVGLLFRTSNLFARPEPRLVRRGGG